MSEETGGPAFAASGHPGQQHVQQRGMTLRDYFAAKFMQGARSNSNSAYELTDLAFEAYRMADLMLKERGGDEDTVIEKPLVSAYDEQEIPW